MIGPTGGCGGTRAALLGAKNGLAARLASKADQYRMRYMTMGLRPYNVFLVWTKWTGKERGEGEEVQLARVMILPSPDVTDLTAVSYASNSAGILPVGSVRLSQVTTLLSFEALTGTELPKQPYYDACGVPRYQGAGIPVASMGLTPIEQALYEARMLQHRSDRIPEPYEFFYELVLATEDNSPPMKFRLFANPFRRPGKFDWNLTLERVSEDRSRTLESQMGIDEDVRPFGR